MNPLETYLKGLNEKQRHFLESNWKFDPGTWSDIKKLWRQGLQR